MRAPGGFDARRIDWRSLRRDRTTKSASTVRIWSKLEDAGAADVRRSRVACMGCVAVAFTSRIPLESPKSRTWLSRYGSRHAHPAHTQAMAARRMRHEGARRAGESYAHAPRGFRGRCVERRNPFPDQTRISASTVRTCKKSTKELKLRNCGLPLIHVRTIAVTARKNTTHTCPGMNVVSHCIFTPVPTCKIYLLN